MFDICFVDGVDDVIEYHVKAENTFNHFIGEVMQDQRGALCFFGVGVVATEIQYFPHTEFFQLPEASCGRLVRTIYPVSDPVEVFQPAFITQGDFLCLQVR